MRRFHQKILSNKKAFTLIEMTIVLFIISILSLLIIPNVTKMRGSIDEKGRDALVSVIKTQSQLYELEVGTKAGSLEALVAEDLLTSQQMAEAGKKGISLSNGVVSVE